MEAKQRITVFCLTWGRRFAFTVNLLLLASLYTYIYMMIQQPDPLMRFVVIAYGTGAAGATVMFGWLWISWRRKGRDKRSGSVQEGSLSDDDLEAGRRLADSGALTP
jgi:hypothetical protein